MAVNARALIDRFRIKPGAAVALREFDSRDSSAFPNEETTKGATAALAKDIDLLQDRLYAEGKRSLLIILQGTDTSGKDGTIRSVFNATGPLGVSVISKKEQAERLQARLDDPTKHWKFNPGDLNDRSLWDEFQAAYQAALQRCSTEWAPWHVVPADRKWVRNAVVAAIVQETLTAMSPQYPQATWSPGEFKID
jgi:polyphosphate kinase 2 (PPK2 family)